MKEIKAYLRAERLESVVRALEDAGVQTMTVLHVRSIRDIRDAPISIEAGAHYIEHVKLEIVCPDALADELVSIIQETARTGFPGDGILFVSQVQRAVKIRTGVEGDDAVK